MKLHALSLLLSTLLLLGSACQKTATDELCTPSLNLEEFDTQLQQELNIGLKGYTYLIMKDGQLKYTHSEGYARSPEDGNQPWNEFQKMHVASISKTITTVAALRLLKAKGLDANEKIYKYLPPDWTFNDPFKNLTFEDLMSQRTGFHKILALPPNTDLSCKYDTLKALVADGVNGFKTRKYSNAHHALLRIILPVLETYPHTSGITFDENYTARRYEEIVQALVFDPLDIEASLFDDDRHAGVLAYSSQLDPDGLFETFDYSLVAGGFGWVLSAYDLAKFWAYLWHSFLLDEDQLQAMRDAEMGLWNSGNTNGGRYYCKLGGWAAKQHAQGPKHWLRSAAVEFPNGTAVILFANSPSYSSLRKFIIEAYENAFGCF